MKDGTRTILVAAAMVVAIPRERPASRRSIERRRNEAPSQTLADSQVPRLGEETQSFGSSSHRGDHRPDGTVKHTRVLGGHPLLAASAEEAAQKNTFEPGPKETTETIEFKF